MSSNDLKSSNDTPAEHGALIKETINSLRSTDGTDLELLEILSTHVLTTTPAETAVSDAASAIESLASKRAEHFDNDESDTD